MVTIAAAGGFDAQAANTGCVGGDCTDVPTDGIRYVNSVDEVNVGDGVPGETSVTPNVEGIYLRKSGVNAPVVDTATTTAFTTVLVNHDGNDKTAKVPVVANPGSPPAPIKIGGQFIFRNGTSPNYSYKVGTGGATYTGAALAQYLQMTSTVAGGNITGSLTVNNPGPNPGSGAAFNTTNADGISVLSKGGSGGNGSCTTILLATWCDDGDRGGNAGSVAVNNDGKITVNGAGKAYGVSAVSQGGTGGDGGGSFGLFGSDAGGGGDGGDGSNVVVNLGVNSDIETYGNGGHGVYARSRGGNGGTGGEPSGLVATGDDGGNGGDAGAVTVVNNGAITTHGEKAYGIYAESIGAGAGSGSGAGGLVAIGGNGGGQSDGNKVTVTNTGTIETKNINSFGIFAQSVGGGGGDGGDTGGLVSIGGEAGSGGDSNTVKVANSGAIKTEMEGSVGVFAQSIGGGGGNGGSAYAVGAGASVAIGGSGGPGGNGGIVIYNETNDLNSLTAATVETSGDRSHGIQAQSVGGGGGNGGFAFSGTVPVKGISASFALGGRGGKGGFSRAVTVNEKGTVTTGGEGAIGIFAQSVGGGGGSGGGSIAAAVGGAYNLSVAVGGKAGPGGAGSTVIVNAVGNITTTGAQSHGILAQSVGGGGGNGGYSVAASAGGLSGSVALGGGAGIGGIGGTVTVNATGAGFVDPTISTTGEGAIGIFAQSVGGGGGNGGLAGTLAGGSGGVGVSLGGKGGGGARGGTVTVTNRNIMKTTGNGASAIFAQSVGGGGGNGGAALSGTGGVVGVSVAVGGSGGGGSDGGEVTVNNYGSITTGYSVESVVDNETVVEHFGNRSYGIFAQSVGGGGGNGGFAIAGALGVSIPKIPGGAAAISVGGKGGGASDGGLVTVNNHGSIETFGLGSHAIFAQSVGGGGGNGGIAGSVAMTVGNGASVGVAVGGAGSGGGNAGVVNVNTFDAQQSIITHADGADGIHAQSVGGGGGDGGFAMAGAFGFGGEKSVNVAVAIGGAGGEGGTGNEVNVTTRQAITTYGHNSNGIMAQSVGGGGGNGGMAVTGTLAFSESAGAVGISVGGGGGAGNIGNTVTVDNYGQITTWGNDAMGILAQSIGGSGGNGGLSIAAQMTGTTKNAATVGVSIGGKGGTCKPIAEGGTCNQGGMVNVTNFEDGTILTNGLGSHGIKAQSIGGGGGNGGLAIAAQLGKAGGTAEQASKSLNVGVSVGGEGGAGGFGNEVHVINHGSITAKGVGANGIFAQSTGGGGGDGGGSVSGIGMLTDSNNADSRAMVVTVAVGGKGGSGNYGGAVTVDNSGSIVTEGVSGYGVFAQSIGGGGGIGGRANTIQLVLTKPIDGPDDDKTANKNNVSAGVSVGGDGGTGGHGGNVVVNNEGTIETWNELSDGIHAQSVGAGGGNGGNGSIGTEGLLPIPGGQTLLKQAIAQLGGLTGSVKEYKDFTVAVGGTGGATGNGGTVEVNNNKGITTHGSNSNGIFAQSIGGGGGVGGVAAIGATGKLGLGGEGGAAGDGNTVTVNQYGGATIETFGIGSNGIFAQSVGGGGGVAGNVNRILATEKKVGSATIPALNMGVGLALGRSGGKGGDGGIVDVDVDGQIITHGDSAAGIFAQSVGGGGGVLGELGNDLPVLSQLSWQIGSAGDAGNAGLVDVNLTGNIVTAGNSATGIFAQSTGGGGTAGAVNVTVDGSILTGAILEAGDEDRGLGSTGILAHSAAVNNANNGDITVSVNSADGVVLGGRSMIVDADRAYVGVGIWVMDGNNNTITNNGLVTTLGGVDAGYAILGSGSDATHAGGNEAVSNFGTVTGSVDLGAGANSFINEEDGIFNSGLFANVGSGNLMTNDGTILPGRTGNVMETTMTGNFQQGATGVFAVDLDMAAIATPEASDRVSLTGEAAVTGLVDVTILNAGNVIPGEHETVIVSAGGTVTDHTGLMLQAPLSAMAQYALGYPNPNDIVINYDIDFSPDGLTKNQAAIGDYLGNVQLAGGADTISPLIAALFGIEEVPELGRAYDSLSPQSYLENLTASMYSNLQFSNALLSCRVRQGPNRFIAETNCGWMRAGGNRYWHDASSASLGFAQDSMELAGGVQYGVGTDWFIGLGGSYTASRYEVSSFASGETVQGQLGAVLKKQMGATLVSASLTGGMAWYDTNRIIAAGPLTIGSSGEATAEFASAHLRISHAFDQGNWYIKPMIDGGLTYLHLDDFNESGAGGIGLVVNSQDEIYGTINPAIEIGGEYQADGMVVRPYARAGLLQFIGDDTPEISAGLADAPAGVAPFTVSGDNDTTFADVAVGLDVLTDGGIDFRVEAAGQISENTRSFGGMMKLTMPF